MNALVLRDRATGSPGTLDERLWAQQDANFNVTALVDGTGAVVERYVYDPYGAVTIYDASYTLRSSSSYAMTILLQGMRYDTISGLYEADARWYSPTLQRWVSLDPMSYRAGDLNLYRFVDNNSVDELDPSGLNNRVRIRIEVKDWNRFFSDTLLAELGTVIEFNSNDGKISGFSWYESSHKPSEWHSGLYSAVKLKKSEGDKLACGQCIRVLMYVVVADREFALSRHNSRGRCGSE